MHSVLHSVPRASRRTVPSSRSTSFFIGFWAAELAHPFYEFTQAGFDVTVASPDGGKVEVDPLSDPRDPSKWSSTIFFHWVFSRLR